MKYIKVIEDLYVSDDCLQQNNENGKWEKARPVLYTPNLKEWFIHYILGKHFTFGQPYCVVCGKIKADTNPLQANQE